MEAGIACDMILPDDVLLLVLRILSEAALFRRKLDAHDPVVTSLHSVPSCSTAWRKAWTQASDPHCDSAFTGVYKQLYRRYRKCALYIFHEKALRVHGRWMWLSFRLQQQCFVLRSDVPRPGQRREFVEPSATQQGRRLVALVKNNLDSVTLVRISTVDEFDLSRNALDQAVGRSHHTRSLCFNEWRAVVACILS